MIGKKHLILIWFILTGLFYNSTLIAQEILSNSVKNFGAKGNGISNDTKAIQKAIDSGIGQIIFPTGVYRITETIIIDLDKSGTISLNGFGTGSISMEGPGPAFKFIGTHAGSADPPTVKNNVWQKQRMPIVDGLEIVGNHPDAIGIEASGTMQLTITRVLIREAFHGIRLFNRNRNVIISECHIYNNRGIGIYLDDINLHQINITNSHISYNNGGGIVVRHGDVHNLQIGSCDIEVNMDKNGPPTANILFDQSKGAILEGAIIGCTIQHDHLIKGSSNIRIIGNGPDKTTEAGNFTIADNNLSETEQCVDIKYSRGIIITANTFYMGLENCIRIDNCQNIILANNIFDKNPHYGTKTMDTKDGIVIIESSDLTISGMHISGSKAETGGIFLERCRNYNLTNSTILNCKEAGIILKESSNGKVSGNFINNCSLSENNKPVSIRVNGGSNNLIINNYFSGIIESHPNNVTLNDNHSFTNE